MFTLCLYGGLFHLTIITIIDKRLVYIYTILTKPTRFTSESLVINLYERFFFSITQTDFCKPSKLAQYIKLNQFDVPIVALT